MYFLYISTYVESFVVSFILYISCVPWLIYNVSLTLLFFESSLTPHNSSVQLPVHFSTDVSFLQIFMLWVCNLTVRALFLAKSI
jgi:hypothetical protein